MSVSVVSVVLQQNDLVLENAVIHFPSVIASLCETVDGAFATDAQESLRAKEEQKDGTQEDAAGRALLSSSGGSVVMTQRRRFNGPQLSCHSAQKQHFESAEERIGRCCRSNGSVVMDDDSSRSLVHGVYHGNWRPHTAQVQTAATETVTMAKAD